MFTRDISLEDCLLDLVDNSIDSLVRRENLDPARDILKPRPAGGRPGKLPEIRLHLADNTIEISDTCGGIPPSDVLHDVFTFGHSKDAQLGQLGAYGIGLKRAIFKIAAEFQMESVTDEGGFHAGLNVDKWAERDEQLDDWKIPVQFTSNGRRTYGTTISFTKLRDEVKMRMRDGAFMGRLIRSIGQTYSLFLEDTVRVKVNDDTVTPMEIPLGQSDKAKPGQLEFTKGDVKVRIIASLAARKQEEWSYERAGWYVLCNGRVVVVADKTDLTGWGEGLPLFHSKYNGFVGAAVFRSHDPLALPWTTTKRNLNREAPVYQHAKTEMVILARPILSFLNNMYPTELTEEPAERKIAERVRPSSIRKIAARPVSAFEVKKSESADKATVRVQYDADKADIEKVRKVLGKWKWSANKIGRHTFQHFLKTECAK